MTGRWVSPVKHDRMDASGHDFSLLDAYWKRPYAKVQRHVTSQQRVRSSLNRWDRALSI